MTAQLATVEETLCRKWAADSPRETISWLTARDRVPADSALNQDRGSVATRSPMAWWTSAIKPRAPIMPERWATKSVTAAVRAHPPRTPSQPPRPRPHDGSPVARETEAGRRTSRDRPHREPVTAPRTMPRRSWAHDRGLMSRRYWRSSGGRRRPEPPEVVVVVVVVVWALT